MISDRKASSTSSFSRKDQASIIREVPIALFSAFVAADVPDAAYVLWGNGSISSAALADGKLTVTASDTPGSAQVAIKKGGTMGTVLWSYLIWVTAEAPSGIVLPPLGGQLYFQWGRKFKEQYYGQVWIWHDEGWKGLQSIHDRAVQPYYSIQDMLDSIRYGEDAFTPYGALL